MVQQCHVSTTESRDSWFLVEELFSHATPGIWWRLIPENDENGDISYATSVEWEYIYPLLIDVKIIEKRMVLGVESLFVIRSTLDTLVMKMQPTR